MKDFRYKIILKAINELGWEVTDKKSDDKLIIVNHSWYISFVDPQKIQFNILCLDYGQSDANKVELCVRMLNSVTQRIKLYAQNGFVIAASEIETTSIMNDSFSMTQCIGMINAEAMASAKSTQKLLEK
jgi:hypothetical protein